MNELPAEIRRQLVDAVDEAFETEQLVALQRLVDQPSHTYAPDDVEAAAQIVDELADSMGLSVQRHPSGDERFADHRVYASAAAVQGEPAIGLIGHVDTVFPRSSGFLKYELDDEVARGPGVLDMKSGLTTILFALSAVRAACGSDYDRLPVQFVCVTDEEVGSPTSRHVYDRIAPSLREALVFEKGRDEDRIVTTRKGGGTFRIAAHGRSAHAGNYHELGVNAIHALSLIVGRLEALTDYERGITVNVGLMEGGTAKNTVPEQASCVVDARFLTVEDGERVRKAVEEIVATPFGPDTPQRLREATYTLKGTITRPPMESTDEIQALRRRYEQWAELVGLQIGEAPRQGGFSDSNLLAAHGVPTIDGLGPYGHGAHSSEEWCSLTSLRQRTQALAMFLAEEIAA